MGLDRCTKAGPERRWTTLTVAVGNDHNGDIALGRLRTLHMSTRKLVSKACIRNIFATAVDVPSTRDAKIGPGTTQLNHLAVERQVAESRDSSGTTVNRRFFCMVPVFATALHEYPASASVLLAQTAPYSNMLLRSLGIGDPDIYYPAFFEGTWNCYSTLIQVTTPQGEDKADRRSVEFSRKQLGYAVPYQVRFTPFEGRVICDRLFTTTSLVEATVGKNVIEEGQWSPQQPNRLVLLLKGGTKVENLVTKRSAEYFQVDQFDTSEFSKQVFDNSAIKDGPPTVKASLNLTRYHWDTAAPVVTKMEAIQKVSIFAVPMEGMEMFNTTTPVTVYKYRIEFER
ncbi:hypothetical protein AXG93_2777s1030 [Marchantia polymorpha subsp. ruderalis]|uniref:DUF6816 domain-containing protein n=1 Tax=Marchantia polymorpha subsp. ruderalis TaxID=1480154 RepID=A0A176VRH8_MARPO|nr:hypothetical protein AXG93_2777s1030 [Marchantia polymorpha subsp. ruderalis]